jgi:LPXTG-motif cell wall-anchored protein
MNPSDAQYGDHLSNLTSLPATGSEVVILLAIAGILVVFGYLAWRDATEE